MTAQLQPSFRQDYILGGKAIVTLVSVKTGERFTYRIAAKEVEERSSQGPLFTEGKPTQKTLFFVSVLTGPNNTEDYQFLGTIFPDGAFRVSRKSRITPDAPSAKAWAWTWEHLDSAAVEVWHEGTCSRCNRPLTDPASIERGLGPICAGRA